MTHHLRWMPSIIAVVIGAMILTGCAQTATRPATETLDQSPAGAYTELGLAYLQRDDLPRAQQALNRALRLDDQDPHALQGMALLAQRQQDNALADRYYQRALDQAPEFTQARNNYATFLFSQKRYEPACQQLERAAEDTNYPRRAQLYSNLGQCRIALGDNTAALQSLERAKTIDPRYARTYLIEARLYIQQGDPVQARHAIRYYQRLSGADAQSQALLNQLDKLPARAPENVAPKPEDNKDTIE
ncbi:type IV pilus biogenesis/stability protein PilW [Larsenimonas suaedae]|uniref:Type IV pilus biogenesis/stability protein PilW n=1 Tax=Larsenimonas suaedae TaxID=1851019 RepID=A0ABU1GSY6_9GAMM|nr:type IV pilus biogenesis/stability protein PilW [Larsenimonas suaedae]MCM2972080.1 type IV pilus biogenesis/stability protein PilW [Larsenimonas suaedae]MDR5895126.1 type IV pilus biogenesis/stability protein PilW [Larsenimonas suaedae]